MLDSKLLMDAFSLEDVEQGGEDDEAQPTLMAYEDGYHFQVRT